MIEMLSSEILKQLFGESFINAINLNLKELTHAFETHH